MPAQLHPLPARVRAPAWLLALALQLRRLPRGVPRDTALSLVGGAHAGRRVSYRCVRAAAAATATFLMNRHMCKRNNTTQASGVRIRVAVCAAVCACVGYLYAGVSLVKRVYLVVNTRRLPGH